MRYDVVEGEIAKVSDLFSDEEIHYKFTNEVQEIVRTDVILKMLKNEW